MKRDHALYVMDVAVAVQLGADIPAPPPAPQKILHVIEYGKHGSIARTDSMTDLKAFLQYLEETGQEVTRVYVEQHFC